MPKYDWNSHLIKTPVLLRLEAPTLGSYRFNVKVWLSYVDYNLSGFHEGALTFKKLSMEVNGIRRNPCQQGRTLRFTSCAPVMVMKKIPWWTLRYFDHDKNYCVSYRCMRHGYGLFLFLKGAKLRRQLCTVTIFSVRAWTCLLSQNSHKSACAHPPIASFLL